MGDNLPAVDLGASRTAKVLALGASHFCAILDNDAVKCWGDGSIGNLGYGDTNARGDGAGEMGDHLPAVDLDTSRTANALALGSSHCCSIRVLLAN